VLDIQFDVEAVRDRLDNMLGRLRHLKYTDLGDEFASWQTQDVHRKHAAVRRIRRGVATTFRPHSRFEMQRRRRFARRLIRKGRFVPRWSTRPILRAELLDQLYERMSALAERLKW
jgi:hypothetical protein